jgi:hypothetical protein
MEKVWHLESLLTGADEAGACGDSRFSEQAAPEQGRFRPGLAADFAAPSAPDSSSRSSLESEPAKNRLAEDETMCPQLALA